MKARDFKDFVAQLDVLSEVSPLASRCRQL